MNLEPRTLNSEPETLKLEPLDIYSRNPRRRGNSRSPRSRALAGLQEGGHRQRANPAICAESHALHLASERCVYSLTLHLQGQHRPLVNKEMNGSHKKIGDDRCMRFKARDKKGLPAAAGLASRPARTGKTNKRRPGSGTRRWRGRRDGSAY